MRIARGGRQGQARSGGANYLDTLACALAVADEIDRAVRIETEAIALDPTSADLKANLKAIRTGGPCLYEQPSPTFRAAPLSRRMGKGGDYIPGGK
jgi:hypothetical protein